MKRETEDKKEKEMRTMYHDNLELKDYVKTGDLYSARTTWEVRSHMLRVAENYPGHGRYAATGWRCQAAPWRCARTTSTCPAARVTLTSGLAGI